MKVYNIGIDTGNRNMKTRHECFVSGIKKTGTTKPFFPEIVKYDNWYYALSNDRVAHMQDKTLTEDYFILCLIALVKEFKARNIDTSGVVNVRLGVGLPPTHLNIEDSEGVPLRNRFAKYFNRGIVEFEYCSKRYCINIMEVELYLQGFAACFAEYEEIEKESVYYLVDIGGYTTDVLTMQNGTLDPTFCESLNFGMIHLYNRIQRKLHHSTGDEYKEMQIEKILLNNTMDGMLAKAIFEETEIYVQEVLGKILEFGVNLRVSPALFIGGGSYALKRWIEKSTLVSTARFQTDIKANALGYEAFLNKKYSQIG